MEREGYEPPAKLAQPAPVGALDSWSAASTIGHEAIYNLHTELVARGRGKTKHDRLLAESARITTRDLPDAVATPRRLAAEWQEAVLLSPVRGGELLSSLSAAVEASRPSVRALLSRQREIASVLQAELETDAPG